MSKKTYKRGSLAEGNIVVKPAKFIRKNLLGKQFGRLFTVEILGVSNKRKIIYRCECSCGSFVNVNGNALTQKVTTSCGCITKERLSSKEHGRLKITVSIEDRFINGVLATYKYNAKRRNLPFNLTKEQFHSFIIKNCFYCDSSASNKWTCADRDHESFMYNGVDRIKNDLGYEINNCVTCCSLCNSMKLSLKKDEFLEQIRKINDFQAKKIN